VETIALLCQSRGIRLTLATFILDTEHMVFYGKSTVQYYNQLLRDLAAHRPEISLIDLEREFADVKDKKDHFFGDHYHPRQRGAVWIADTLAAH
jgi:hypothetical protein